MLYIIYTIHVIICLFLIMVVLLQQGSGADLSVFGGGGTQTAFGARSATSLLHKLTVAGFIGFILTTIAFGFLKSGGPRGSVMSEIEQASEAEAAADEASEEAAAPAEPDAGGVEAETQAPEFDPPSEAGADPEAATPDGGGGS